MEMNLEYAAGAVLIPKGRLRNCQRPHRVERAMVLPVSCSIGMQKYADIASIVL